MNVTDNCYSSTCSCRESKMILVVWNGWTEYLNRYFMFCTWIKERLLAYDTFQDLGHILLPFSAIQSFLNFWIFISKSSYSSILQSTISCPQICIKQHLTSNSSLSMDVFSLVYCKSLTISVKIGFFKIFGKKLFLKNNKIQKLQILIICSRFIIDKSSKFYKH